MLLAGTFIKSMGCIKWTDWLGEYNGAAGFGVDK
jgi:hypothetical protein